MQKFKIVQKNYKMFSNIKCEIYILLICMVW